MAETKRKPAGYKPNLRAVASTGGNFKEPPNAGTTGDGGGGNPLELRVVVLETRVEHIMEDAGVIKDDIRDMRNIGIGAGGVFFVALIGLYVYIGDKAGDLDTKINSSTQQITAINSSIENIKTQNADIKADIKQLADSVSKLAQTNEPKRSQKK